MDQQSSNIHRSLHTYTFFYLSNLSRRWIILILLNLFGILSDLSPVTQTLSHSSLTLNNIISTQNFLLNFLISCHVVPTPPPIPLLHTLHRILNILHIQKVPKPLLTIVIFLITLHIHPSIQIPLTSQDTMSSLILTLPIHLALI